MISFIIVPLLTLKDVHYFLYVIIYFFVFSLDCLWSDHVFLRWGLIVIIQTKFWSTSVLFSRKVFARRELLWWRDWFRSIHSFIKSHVRVEIVLSWSFAFSMLISFGHWDWILTILTVVFVKVWCVLLRVMLSSNS